MAIIKGKAYWAKVIGEPGEAYDPGEREWSIDVTVDKEARKVLEQLGVADKINDPEVNKKGEKRAKPHESGMEYITFRRKELKKDGTPSKPIRIVDSKKNPWPEDKLIGNDSVVIVQFSVNEGEYRGKPWKKPSLLAIMVKEHVPYDSDEFDDYVDPDGFDDEVPF